MVNRFLFFLLLLISTPVLAQSTNNNPWVKVQNGHLWVLSADNVTYTPYIVKAVGYSPIPVGRYPSDWGYATTDPRSTNNNVYDDPDILNRDFSLLQQMNANAIRIWKGNNTFSNGRFTGYITNATTTINKDSSQNTLDLAAHYGLKVIAGFWVNQLIFDANNNIGSTDENGNYITAQQIINNFLNYVNTLKGSRAILFWAIGNENNYQVLNAGTISIAAFEKVFGMSYGDSIYHWLQQTANFLDFDNGIIVDLNSSDIVNILRQQYPADYNVILNILKQYSGQSLTPQQLSAWYALVDQMAHQAHVAEDPTGGKSYHPVALVNGEIGEIGNAADGTTDAQMPDLDIWGANVYRGESFGTLFGDYAFKSQKPLWISEFGIDAWSVTNPANINVWGMTLSQDLGSGGNYDPVTQSTWDVALWNEIYNNSAVAIGGSVMEYSDEWWKPYEFYCTNPNVSQSDNAISAGICNSNQKYFGNPYLGFPDSFMNQEWFGVVSIKPNPIAGSPDIVTPRQVYNDLATQWANIPVLSGTLIDTLTGQPLTDMTGPMLWTIPAPKAQGLYGSAVAVAPKQFPNFQMTNLVDGTYTLIFNLQGHTITYRFTITPNSPYNSTALNVPVPITKSSAGAGGAISPSGVYVVPNGTNQNFIITADTGYNIDQVLVDGVGVISPSTSINNYSYTFTNVIGAHTISASFRRQAPIVTLLSNSYAYTAPASVYLSAYTAEIGGTISKVEFYNGPTLIATSTSPMPAGQYSDFVYIWNNAVPGNYSLTAKAYDNNGNVTTSAPATFTINAPPVITLGVSLGALTNSPYNYVWNDTSAEEDHLTDATRATGIITNR